MTFQTLRYDKSDRIATVVFSTPEALNALTEARFSDLERVLDDLEADGDLGAAIITGEGRAFCVGLDLDLLARAFDDMAYFEHVVRRLNAIITRLETLPIPVIAAVNGFARAGGFEITLGCDFIVVGDRAKIGDVHTDAGVLPACATLRLKRRIGEQKAKALIWTARWLTGQEAVDWGLALQVFAQDELQAGARALAANLAEKPRPALEAQKRLFRQGADLGVADGAELELQVFVAYMSNQPYGKEGYLAFRENRSPSWKQARP